jgi:hypothetical protein
MASIKKIVKLLASDTFVNYSTHLPFSDSDQSMIADYLAEHPDEIEMVYGYLIEVRKLIEDFDGNDDEEDVNEEEYDTFCESIKNSKLVKWVNEKYRR